MEKQHITVVVILDLSAAFDIVAHNILKILESQFRVTDTECKWFDSYLRPRLFKVCIDDEYSESQQLNFSVPQGSCSRANIFTCYCALINEMIPEPVSINGFANDCSPQKHLRQETNTTKQLLEDTFNNIKDWMDKMWLKLNTDKRVYIIWLITATQ